MKTPSLVPKLVTTLQNYDRTQFGRDVTAGIIVGIVALPLAIAFAIASGVTPDRGLWTAIVAGFLISALGGSRVQIGGPTGAFVVVDLRDRPEARHRRVDRLDVHGRRHPHRIRHRRLGAAIKFIPHPVVTGFTSGIARHHLLEPDKDLLGPRDGRRCRRISSRSGRVRTRSGIVTRVRSAWPLLALAIIVLWPRIQPADSRHRSWCSCSRRRRSSQMLEASESRRSARASARSRRRCPYPHLPGSSFATSSARSSHPHSRSRSSARSNRCCRQSSRTE